VVIYNITYILRLAKLLKYILRTFVTTNTSPVLGYAITEKIKRFALIIFINNNTFNDNTDALRGRMRHENAFDVKCTIIL